MVKTSFTNTEPGMLRTRTRHQHAPSSRVRCVTYREITPPALHPDTEINPMGHLDMSYTPIRYFRRVDAITRDESMPGRGSRTRSAARPVAECQLCRAVTTEITDSPKERKPGHELHSNMVSRRADTLTSAENDAHREKNRNQSIHPQNLNISFIVR